MTEASRSPQPLNRMPSGVPGLDMVLNGGFFQGGLYLIMGLPGAGKTIFANQICFSRAAAGERAVYVTLLAETHARMLVHLQSLKFFDPEPIADSLYYISGYRVLEKTGLDGLLQMLRGTVRDHQATMLIIDGLVTASSVAENDLAFKRFIHELQVYVEVTNCTTFLLTQSEHSEHHPEHTMVDGLIELTDQRVGLRVIRELEVRKFRGSGYLRGKHTFDITDTGITVYPRIESMGEFALDAISEDQHRVSTGVKALDLMMHEGLMRGSSTLLLGTPGTGKTILGLHFLTEGAKQGEAGLHLGFYEAPARLIGKAESVGLPFRAAVETHQIEIMWQAFREDLLDRLASNLFERLDKRPVQRLFIDGLNPLMRMAISPQRTLGFLSVLTSELRRRNITVLMSSELQRLIGITVDTPLEGLSAIVENIILLRYVENGSQLHRLISVLKMRESAHDLTLHEFHITDHGIEVALDAQSAHAILGGSVSIATRGQLSSKRRRK